MTTDLKAKDDSEMDKLEKRMLREGDLVDCPVKHSFTGGFYIRELFMPKGSLLTTKIHKTKHPFFIKQGVARVYSHNSGYQIVKKGHTGMTLEGTRRLLFIEEDCVLVTVHPLSDEEEAARASGHPDSFLIGMIEERIIEKRLLPENGGRSTSEIFKELLDEKRSLSAV